MFKPLVHVRKLLAAAFAVGATLSAHAGFYTDNEAGMDAIFSQASFGGNTIDIRFNSVLTIHNSALLIIDGAADSELLQLDAISGSGPTVGMFFVDSIAFCGGPTSSTVGCAFIDDNTIALNSTFAAGSFGAKLAAHELGHALGLNHIDDLLNLMDPIINASTSANLLAGQVGAIGLSSLIQTDRDGQRFITIQPYEVLADLVTDLPEPGSLALVGLALGLAAWRGRRA